MTAGPRTRHLRESITVCLAVPMQVLASDGLTARCAAKGVERDVSLFLLMDEDLQPGDMVMVHLGHAIEKISAERARSVWALYDEMLAAADALGDAARGA